MMFFLKRFKKKEKEFAIFAVPNHQKKISGLSSIVGNV